MKHRPQVSDAVFQAELQHFQIWIEKLSEKYARAIDEGAPAYDDMEINDDGIEFRGAWQPTGYGVQVDPVPICYTIPWWVIHRERKGEDWEQELEEQLRREQEERERQRIENERRTIKRIEEQRYDEYLELMQRFEPERFKELMEHLESNG